MNAECEQPGCERSPAVVTPDGYLCREHGDELADDLRRQERDPEALIVALADAGLLTARQAEAYVLRECERYSRKKAAETAGISPNVVDKHLYAARDKIEHARETIRLLD